MFRTQNINWDTILNDNHRENTQLNKTEALSGSMGMNIMAVGTLNQLSIVPEVRVFFRKGGGGAEEEKKCVKLGILFDVHILRI